MQLKDVESTYICQFCKPGKRDILRGFKNRKDYSVQEFVRLYNFVRDTLEGTPAWGKPGVNELMNEMDTSLRASLTHAKVGKSSAPKYANKILNTISYHGYTDRHPTYGKCELKPLLTSREINELLALYEATEVLN
jgi:hypothetical protein